MFIIHVSVYWCEAFLDWVPMSFLSMCGFTLGYFLPQSKTMTSMLLGLFACVHVCFQNTRSPILIKRNVKLWKTVEGLTDQRVQNQNRQTSVRELCFRAARLLGNRGLGEVGHFCQSRLWMRGMWYD